MERFKKSRADAAARVAALEKIEVTPGCCCCFTVASWVAGGQQLELLLGGLRRWNYIRDGAAVVRGERGEGEERQKRGGKEKRREGRGREGCHHL
ncbi:hypothetical protein MTR67_038498 [Solanum verrucosum]|uniref:Uncharacterized protein n=1 Tax=Solanum verrucosum TaxID=315347 RepID=A0AAF0UFB8_SOLVR|nr:hypothetical protein MTR67_038498 [Solanum verrucosum]